VKTATLFKTQFCEQAPDKNSNPAIGSWAQEAARIAGIRPREGWNRPRKGGVVLRGSLTIDSGGWTARRACQRGGLPAACDGGRQEVCCGAAEARAGQGGVRVAILGGQG
jgi:hypothetical protein